MKNDITVDEFRAHYKKNLLSIQRGCKRLDQVEMPVLHDFSPGLYLRSIFMPAGTFVIGKTHKTEHFNIVLSGVANVMIDGHIERIEAPSVFKSGAGVKKVLYILEDMVWMTTHPTDETDLKKLEEIHVYSDEEEKILIEKELKKHGLQGEEQGEQKRYEEGKQKVEEVTV